MRRIARAYIDRQALTHNLACTRRFAPNAKVMAVVKANAYGHGLERVASWLAGGLAEAHHNRADAFGVSSLKEALILRSLGIQQPLVLLAGFFDENELEEIQAHDLQVVLHQVWQVDVLVQAKLAKPITVWMKLDTGLHRIGFEYEQLDSLVAKLARSANVRQSLHWMTHFANADDVQHEMTKQQINTFKQMVEGRPGQYSLSSSAGVLAWPAGHGDWVRPGIMLYGASPMLGKEGSEYDLQPVMSFESALVAIRRFRQGDPIGYGGSWCCPEEMDIGVVSVGYGDGYPRQAPNGTPVLVGNTIVPLVGRVSMDMLMVDLRAAPNIRVGDPVVLWGKGLPVERVARSTGTIANELLCGLSRRVSIKER